MSGGSSEEKSEPASAKKLRDEREKGKVAKGPDLMVAVTTGVLIGYVLVAARSLSARLEELFATASRCTTFDFDHGAPIMLAAVRSALMACALPSLLIATLAAVLAALMINKGFIFSLEPLSPKPEKLNPMTGLKNLYKLNNWVELAKSLAKAVLFGGALAAIARAAVGPLLEVPACSPGCIPPMVHSMMMPLLGASAMFYLVSGILDLLIQKWLFLRDMRMSKTEVKRERKDTMGNPLVKRQQRRLRRESTEGGRLGIGRATVLICGADEVVGLRYVKGETPLPTVMCRGVGEKSVELIKLAKTRKLPMFWDKALVAELGSRVKAGQVITPPFFKRVAHAVGRARP